MAASKQPKRGAPTKGDLARTRVLQIRLTEKEFDRIMCVGRGSRWARALILEAMEKKGS